MPVTSAQVSMLNTGGWVGSLLGVFALLDITAAGNAVNGGALSAAYLGISTLGLAGGALAGTFIDFTWGETLLLDLGGVLGLVAGGTIGLAVASQNVFPGAAGTDFATGMAGGGTLLGLGAMAATLITLRTLDNKPLLRNLGIAPTVGTPQTLIGRDGKPFMVAPMLAFTF
jgi:hypothetical protein